MPQHTNEFQLLVETGLLEGTAGGDICLATNPTPGNGHGGLDVPATSGHLDIKLVSLG